MIVKSGLPGIHFIEKGLLDDLSVYFPLNIWSSEAELIYKGHIPAAAYILFDGKVELSKRKAMVTLLPGSILGAVEIYKNKVFRFNARVSKGGKIMILDKSTLLEVLHHHHPPIKKSFTQVLE